MLSKAVELLYDRKAIFKKMMNLCPLMPSESQSDRIHQLSQQWGFEVRPPNDRDPYVLEICKDRLQLRKCHEPKLGAICVDFLTAKSQYRRKFGGGRRQAIAKAVGLKKGFLPKVLDATAGLGRDAFVLASLGCRVHMLERSPVIAALLEDGLNRAQQDAEIGMWVSERLSCSFHDSCQGLSQLPFQPDVIYLDPMYPEKRKSALVKKEMQVFQSFIGVDSDGDALLKMALDTAQRRVVVKRPVHAGWLGSQPTEVSIQQKKHRFDVYFI